MTQPVLPTPDAAPRLCICGRAAPRLCICGRTIVGALSSCCFWHGLVVQGRLTLEQVQPLLGGES